MTVWATGAAVHPSFGQERSYADRWLTPLTGWDHAPCLTHHANEVTVVRPALGVPLLALALLTTGAPAANAETALGPPLQKISQDPYTQPPGQHRTEVEPDSFSFGSTIVMAAQVGRIFDGGATNIGFSTSTDGGLTWTQGFLPGITVVAGGQYQRASDPAVAYDPEHDVWLISSLAIDGTNPTRAVVTSRSTDGGFTWSNPITTATGVNLDKNWIVCDTTATSPFYGNCYTQYDDNGLGNRLKMTTSTDGGLTWGPQLNTANNATGLGGQPVVQPNGTVIVPTGNAFLTQILSYRSTNGGASWSATTLVANVQEHLVAGNLRTPVLPSAEIDGAGRVYLTWSDCRFRAGCTANDLVLSTSTDGLTWTAPQRIPIGPVTSGADFFIPGIGVDRSTSGATARIGLAFYFYSDASCSASTCQLSAGYISSANGGASWTRPIRLAGPMSLSWIANTSQGRMVGDYISTSWSGGTAHPVFAVARPPSGGVFDEAIYTTLTGLAAGPGTVAMTTVPVATSASDRVAGPAVSLD